MHDLRAGVVVLCFLMRNLDVMMYYDSNDNTKARPRVRDSRSHEK